MLSILDIYRSAAVLIREHGEDAALEAVEELERQVPKQGQTLN